MRTSTRIGRWARHTITSIAACVMVSATALTVSATPASAAGTPRAQFWDGTYRGGYKLDKDVWSQGFSYVADLSQEGLSCWFCNGNWDNRISSLSTTGGGQSPVDVLVYTEKYFGGTCVYIPKDTVLDDLTFVPLRDGWISLSDRISSFGVYSYSVLPPPGCRIYSPWVTYP